MAPEPACPAGLRRLLPRGRDLHRDRRDRHRLPLLVLGRRRLRGRRRLGRPDARQEAGMSWAAHDLEPYAFQKHLNLKVAFVPLLIGSYAPDMMTKWFVYGGHPFRVDLKASNPGQVPRGWTRARFPHSVPFGRVTGPVTWT